jgi:acetyltransferase-like isoleucine patch superfamily enzyme
MSGLTYTQTVPFPTPVSASPSSYPDRLSQNDYKRVPPLHDPSRQEPDIGTPQSSQSNMPPHMNLLHPSHNNSPHHLTPQSANVRDTAQMALNHPAASRQRTQKEEMLAGKHYFPFDRELVMERERCNAACWRFNSSTNPNNGVSQEERSRQFRDILMPKEPINISPTIASHVSPTGHVGNNVVVEAPFTCDYGYNIHIGQDVAIGKNCTILDTCEVRIGDRCILGPNVQIYTATLPVDPKRRLGSRGPNLGKSITIEEDCWIGGGVIILPGRTIKRGSTVGAGSIVTRVREIHSTFVYRAQANRRKQDVPPYTVVCGNPARVTRGLYPPHE